MSQHIIKIYVYYLGTLELNLYYFITMNSFEYAKSQFFWSTIEVVKEK